MAIILEAAYSKKLGLPNYSSHSYVVSIRTELSDLTQVEEQSARLYTLLQQSVDGQIQEVGFLPDATRYGMDGCQPASNGNGNGKHQLEHPATPAANPVAEAEQQQTGWRLLETFFRESPIRDAGKPDAVEVIRALRCHGVGVSVRHDLTYASVRATIRAGFPIITGIGREVCETGDHFVTIYGIGWKPSRVFICNQPRLGRSREELLWADFRATWAPRGHGLICWGKQFPA